VDIVGDYDDEEDLYDAIRNEFQDITVEVFAMLLEDREDWLEALLEEAKKYPWQFEKLAEVGLLEHCSGKITFQIVSHFGNDWKETYYKNKRY
jgi:hypothetical protein